MTTKSDAIACTLTQEDRGDRVKEWQELVAAATARRETAEGAVVLTFPPGPEVAARVADLAAREKVCCSFYDFKLHITGAAVELEVSAPEEARPLVDELIGAG